MILVILFYLKLRSFSTGSLILDNSSILLTLFPTKLLNNYIEKVSPIYQNVRDEFLLLHSDIHKKLNKKINTYTHVSSSHLMHHQKELLPHILLILIILYPPSHSWLYCILCSLRNSQHRIAFSQLYHCSMTESHQLTLLKLPIPSTARHFTEKN